MAKLWALDVQTKIISMLTSASDGLNYNIGLINTSRGESCTTALSIHSGVQTFQYPEVFVDIGDSSEYSGPFDGIERIDVMTQEIPIFVSAFIKSCKKIDTWKEIYIEAITKTLHNRYIDDDTNYIKAVNDMRGSYQDERRNAIEEFVVVQLKVTVNDTN